MAKKSRDKGKRGEREAAEILRPLFPDVRRRAMQARGGSEGADLENTPGFHVEVGIGKAPSPHAKWTQATEDLTVEKGVTAIPALPGHPVPVALTRRDRGEWLVTMHVNEFVELVRKARLWDRGLEAAGSAYVISQPGATIDEAAERGGRGG